MTRLGRVLAGSMAAGVVVAGLAVAPSYADDPPVAGELTSGDSLYPDQGNGGYDVSHYALAYTWNPGPPGGTIDATTTITATTTTPGSAPLSSFGLDFEGTDLTVSSVTVNGVPATYTRIDEADSINRPKKHKLVVTPATPIAQGTFTTVVHFAGTPHERGGETAGSDEGWIPTSDGVDFMNQPIGAMTGFPHNNTPKDKATYDIAVDVPAGMEVVSNGEPDTVTPAVVGGRQTWVWHQTKQMASELVTIGIGQYDVRTGTVHLSGGRDVPEYSFVDSTMSASSKATFNTQANRLSAVLSGLEAFLGPYPGNSAGIVLDNSGVGYALETQDRPTWSTAGFIADSFEHELTHQWYGDAVAPADWNGIWVNEGMATWAPVHLDGNNESVFFNEWNSTAASSSRWLTPPSGMTAPQQLFGWQSYDRGAMTYEALRAAIGDAAFFALIKQWQTTYGGQTRKWTDMIAMAQQISGRDLTAFFQDWIYDANKPAWPGKLNLALATSPASGAVPAGGQLSFTVTATNTGRVPLTGAVVTVDLADVLDDATLGTLPAGVTVAGTTLTWSVPTTGTATAATATIPVTVRADATQGHTLGATASVSTLGGTCTACTTSLTVGPATQQPPPPPPTSPLTIPAACTVAITGKAKVGKTLTARTKGCLVAVSSRTVGWFANGHLIKGADGSTYTLKRRQRGQRITVRVLLQASGYTDAERTSAATKKVRPPR